MTNSTIAAEQLGLSLPGSASYLWEIPDKPVSVYLSLDLIDKLEREVIDSFKAVTKRGSEIGGFLLGRTAPSGKRAVFVESYEPVTCDYSRGPLYLLSDEDKQRLVDALQKLKHASAETVVGFFRSNTRKDLALDEDDLAIVQKHFASPDNVLLLVKPFAMKPSLGGFFIWEDGHMKGDASYLQFPFRRSELMKEFGSSIIAPGALRSAPAAAPPGPVAIPKREERVAITPPPRPTPVVMPPAAKREEPAPPPPAATPISREEKPPSAPLSFKREPRAPIAPAIPKPEERPVPVKVETRAPVVPPPPPKIETRAPVVPPAPPKIETRAPAAPPAPPKIETRTAMAPPARTEERPVKPEPRPTPAPVPPAVKREERPAPAPVAAPPKVEARPSVTLRREEPRPSVSPVKPVKEEPPAPKKEERPPATPVVVKAEAPAPAAPAPERKEEPPAATAATAPKPEAISILEEPPAAEKAAPGLLANKWLWLAVVVVLVAVGAFFFLRGSRGTGTQVASTDSSLALKVERNAGQLVLSWNRNATLISTAQRATLSINDGEYKEDAELDLGALRSGSIVYSPITNDVSFRLEVTDLKNGKSLSETVRAIAGRPSPMSPQTAAAPGTDKPAAAPTPAANAPNAAGAPNVAGAPATSPAVTPSATQTTPPPVPPAPKVEQPTVSVAPAVTAVPPKPESLSARLRPAEVPAPPSMDPGSSSLDRQPALPGVSLPSAPPPSAPKPAAGQPAAPAPAARPAAAAPQTGGVPRVGGNVQEAVPLSQVPPQYPPLARQTRVSGIVRVEATIGKDGKVKKTNAVSGPPLLRRAAADAVQRWTYQPKRLNGEPVECTVQVDVNFALQR